MSEQVQGGADIEGTLDKGPLKLGGRWSRLHHFESLKLGGLLAPRELPSKRARLQGSVVVATAALIGTHSYGDVT